jgi:ferric-chelate reductase
VLDHLRSEIMVVRNGKAIGIPEDSLLAMESVKLQNGRPDLSALLRDEVELATGRMAVSGQSSSPHLQIKIMPILLLVCGSQTIVRSVCGALRFPVCSPLSAANGGPSVTLHIESFGYA